MSSDTASTNRARHPGWEGILDPDEEILWQGRPSQRFALAPGGVATAVFGLFFSGFALFWMVMAASMGAGFWMFGLIHFTVGLFLVWKALFGTIYRYRRTWYTLTDRRAFVATESLGRGRTLKSYPITDQSPVVYIDASPATIHFAREERVGGKGRRYTVPVGFEKIAEGAEVMALIRRIQRGKGEHVKGAP